MRHTSYLLSISRIFNYIYTTKVTKQKKCCTNLAELRHKKCMSYSVVIPNAYKNTDYIGIMYIEMYIALARLHWWLHCTIFHSTKYSVCCTVMIKYIKFVCIHHNTVLYYVVCTYVYTYLLYTYFTYYVHKHKK